MKLRRILACLAVLSQIGQMAAKIPLAAIDGRSTHGTRLVPCQLVVRASTRTP